MRLKTTLACSPIALLAAASGTYAAQPAVPASAPDMSQRPNVLFIVLDDLNHWIGALGRNVQTKTPSIDALAKRGTVFTNAYCPAPLCNPSRAAILSGTRPSTTGVYENSHDWRTVAPKEKTIIGAFSRAGYRTVGVGKVYDYKYPRDEDYDAHATRDQIGRFPAPDPKSILKFGEPETGWIDCPDEVTPEYKMVSYALDEINAQAARGKDASPLFLAVGLFRPHAPWHVPKKYYDMHPVKNITPPPITEDDLDDMPPAARRLARGGNALREVRAAGKWRELIQGYLAAVSYADAQLARLFDGLAKHPQLNENTIIVLWGDNGWHLGEKHHFGKYTLWEEATRIPYLWVVPGLTKPGTRCDGTVDLMSIYPTLLALCCIEKPAHVEGEDIRVLLENPGAAWDKSAISTFRPNNHSIRQGPWRYTRYEKGGEELYNHADDPYEWENLADAQESKPVIARLSAQLPKTNAEPIPLSDYWKERFNIKDEPEKNKTGGK